MELFFNYKGLMYKSKILFFRLMVIPYLLNKIVARISRSLRKLMTISLAA